MTVNGISGANTPTAQMGMSPAADSYSKNLQRQIANAQKQLQELSSNKEMTPEEKKEKQQEIRQQVNDLNRQLRQYQMEQRRAEHPEKQQSKGSSMEDRFGQNAQTGRKSAGLSQASMTAMISADTSIKQAKVQGSVAAGMEGRAGVLETEIKLDEARGGDVTKKKEELADVTQKAQAAAASQMNTLAEAGKDVEEAAEAERTERKASGSREENAEQTAVYTQVDVRL